MKNATTTPRPSFVQSLYSAAAACLAADSIDPIRSLLEERGGAWADCLRRYDAGKMPPVFIIDGNSKLPFAAFSSLPGLDCPGAGACLYREGSEAAGPGTGFCYSFKAWRYPAAFFRQLVNSLRLRSEAGRAEILNAWASLKPGATVRLYVDGDFASVEIISFWFRALHARPDLNAYGYSKSWALLSEFNGPFPPNYRLNLSSGGTGGESLKAAVAALPITRGEFIAVRTSTDHGAAYQSRKHPGHRAYAADIINSAGHRVFVCPGRCGECTPSGHACGSERFTGVPIAIGVH